MWIVMDVVSMSWFATSFVGSVMSVVWISMTVAWIVRSVAWIVMSVAWVSWIVMSVAWIVVSVAWMGVSVAWLVRGVVRGGGRVLGIAGDVERAGGGGGGAMCVAGSKEWGASESGCAARMRGVDCRMVISCS